jgi:hypothetical protein
MNELNFPKSCCITATFDAIKNGGTTILSPVQKKTELCSKVMNKKVVSLFSIKIAAIGNQTTSLISPSSVSIILRYSLFSKANFLLEESNGFISEQERLAIRTI